MEDRKKDHINLALESQASWMEPDQRFYYEPVLSSHKEQPFPDIDFAGKVTKTPVWISSMTGGTNGALEINRNLASLCNKYKMGMGLGSCRSLLKDDTHLPDFDMRDVIGPHMPLFANLGISQTEHLVESNKLDSILRLIDKLRADGLVIHVNPLQEWLQPEGDRLKFPPIDTIKRVLDKLDLPIIVKEVGQGMGPESLSQLLKLPLEAIEFGAWGGTNFATVEMKRGKADVNEYYQGLAQVGHNAEEMTVMINQIIELSRPLCKKVIISGGIRDFLDGYYLINKINMPAVYGQASSMLKHAKKGYDKLEDFMESQIKGLHLANAFLKVK